MEPFAALSSRSVVLRQANIDTDQIIPAVPDHDRDDGPGGKGLL